MKVSVIMPAYNEEASIEGSIRHAEVVMRELGLDYEIIAVNDGSRDGTEARAKAMGSNPHVKVVSLPTNMGKGFALRRGFFESTGDPVLFIDSDAEIAPRQISSYIQAVKEGDVLIGCKWHRGSRTRMPFARKLLSHGYQLFVRLTTSLRCEDSQSGLKAFRRKVLEELMPILVIKRFAYDVELLAAAQARGYRIVEFPVSIEMMAMPRIYDLVRMIASMVLETLKIAYRMRVMKLYDVKKKT